MFKKSLKRIVALILLCLVVLASFETAARVVLPLKIKRTMYSLVRDIFNHHPEHVQFSSTTGFVVAPLIRYRLRTWEYTIDITTNSQGLRDHKESMEKPDVVILGDSFVFGTGVSNGRTASDHLERQLGLRVLNAGVAGYGPLQKLRLLQDLLARDIVPQLCTFAFFYSGNDLSDNLGYANLRNHAYLVRHGETYEVVEPIRDDFQTWTDGCSLRRYPLVCQYSYTAYLIARTGKALTHKRTDWPQIDCSGSIGAFEHVASAFARLPIAPKPVFICIPARHYYESDFEKRRGDTEFSRISSILSCAGLPLLDLRSALTRSDYHRYDGHWREKQPQESRSIPGTLLAAGAPDTSK